MTNYWNPGNCVLIWENSARTFQWIPTWQGLDSFQKSLRSCALDKSSLSIGRVDFKQGYITHLGAYNTKVSSSPHAHAGLTANNNMTNLRTNVHVTYLMWNRHHGDKRTACDSLDIPLIHPPRGHLCVMYTCKCIYWLILYQYSELRCVMHLHAYSVVIVRLPCIGVRILISAVTFFSFFLKSLLHFLESWLFYLEMLAS